MRYGAYKKLIQAIKESEIHEKYAKTIEKMYFERRSVVRAGNKTSESFQVTKGLKQRCSFSLMLFKIYIQDALNEWRKKCRYMGTQVEKVCLYNLLFANDQVVVTSDRDDMIYMLRKLKDTYPKTHLIINFDTTSYLVVCG